MKPEIDVIIFDCDGVVIDSGADIANAVQYTMKYFGVPFIESSEIISYLGKGPEVLIRRCFKDCSEEIIQLAVPFYRGHYIKNCIIDTKLNNNVKETLEYFKNKKIAMVTNKPEDMTKKILTGLGVDDYFKLIIGPESVKNTKPHPEGLLKVLSTFGVEASKAIMIGDSNYDIEAGKSAGMYTCGVTFGLGSIEELTKSGPDFMIGDMFELVRVIG